MPDPQQSTQTGDEQAATTQRAEEQVQQAVARMLANPRRTRRA